MLRVTVLSSLMLAAPVVGQDVIVGNARTVGVIGSSPSAVEMNSLTSIGDPKAIKPAFDALKVDGPESTNKDRQLKDAIRTVGQFGYAQAIEVLEPMLGNQQLGPSVRDEALIALSRMNDKKLIAVLKRELDTPRSLTARSHAAKALVEFGEPEGRPFLLAELQNHLDELDNPRQYLTGVRDVLKTMADQELADSVAAMAEKQKSETAKANLTSLVGAMRINLKPTPEILAIAQDTAWAKKDDRYTAIAAIGERGTPAEIPALLALKAWDAAGIDGDPAMLRHDLRTRAALAVGRIQARCWQQLEESKTPLVTNTQRRLEELHGDPPMPVRPVRPRPALR